MGMCVCVCERVGGGQALSAAVLRNSRSLPNLLVSPEKLQPPRAQGTQERVEVGADRLLSPLSACIANQMLLI